MESRHAIVVPFSPRGPVSHRIVLWRKDGIGFSDREVLLLGLVRPHLAEMRDAAFRRQASPSVLTARQQELLRLVAGGQTNRQIARHLHISEGTVRKHLENIYLRLGVENRVSAVDRAFRTLD
jgi:DNA-binding NarL/FixJ family response regulator